MFFKDRLLGLRKMGVLFITRSSCWEATVDRDFLHRLCIISCVRPHYFRSAFRSAFQRSGFHSCPQDKHRGNFKLGISQKVLSQARTSTGFWRIMLAMQHISEHNVGSNYRFVIVVSIFDIQMHHKLNVTVLQQKGTQLHSYF